MSNDRFPPDDEIRPVPPAEQGGPDSLDASVWRAAVEQSPFSTVIYDAGGSPRVINEAFRALWGVGLETLPAGYSVLTDPQLEEQGILPYVRRAFEGEVVTSPLVRYDISRVSGTGAGHTVWTQGHFYPIRDRTGRIAHVVLTHIDLTERVAAEEALRASERRFGALVHQASAGIAQVDLTGRFILMNDRYCDEVGRPREELLHLRMQEITHPDDLPGNLVLLRRALETGEPFTIEKRYLRPDGSVVWVNNSVAPVRDEDGNPTSILAVSTDITERRRAEEALRVLADAADILSSSLDYESTLQAVAELMVPALASWSIVFTDGGGLAPVACACAVPGKRNAVEEMARCLAALPPTEPHPVRIAAETGDAQLVRTIDSAFLDSVTADPEYRRLVRELAPVSLIAAPLVARERVLGILLLVSDDVSRRFDERDLATARELAQRAAVAIDNARLFQAEQEALARAVRLQQITSRLAAALPMAEVGDLIVTEVRTAFDGDTAWLGLLAGDGAEFVTLAHSGFPARAIAPWLRFPAQAPIPAADVIGDGEPRWFRSADEMRAAYPATAGTIEQMPQQAVVFLPLVVGSERRGVMALGSFERREFSEPEREFAAALAQQCAQALERARLFDAERAARAEAEAANRSKADFLASMSHELRTPLNAIGGYVDLILMEIRGPVSETQRADLERVQRSQRHLLGLINEVLNYARLESGAVTYDLRPTLVADVVAASVPLVEPQRAAKGISLDVRLPEFEGGGSPVLVLADREKLQQILLNLLSNAVKFTPRGGHVAVELRSEPDEHGTVALRVMDDGVGIPADRLDEIFEPFVQVGRALNNPTEGTGLGLAISRDLARIFGHVGLAPPLPELPCLALHSGLCGSPDLLGDLHGAELGAAHAAGVRDDPAADTRSASERRL
jgi:PAS domain S-box-containing protein